MPGMAREAYESIPCPVCVVQSRYPSRAAAVIGTLVVIEANGFGKGVVVGLFDARRVFSAKLTS